MSILREHSNWEFIRVTDVACRRIFRKPDRVYVRGDLQGPLTCRRDHWVGFLEYPAKGHAEGSYEIVLGQGKQEAILRRVQVHYIPRKPEERVCPPTWQNVNRINRLLSRWYTPFVEREIIYRYPSAARNIQLLRVTDPKVPMSGKQVVLLTARIHWWESGSGSSQYRFLRWLLDGPGNAYLREYLFLLIPYAMPLENDPRGHAVNREWVADMVEPDLIAIRDKVIDRYVPEIWIDTHNFGNGQGQDYTVVHPVGENFFDAAYANWIVARLAKAAERKGHRQSTRTFHRKNWRNFSKGPFICHGEKIAPDLSGPASAVSAKDYARYSDRCYFGRGGRNWPAMACEYGYFRCHAVNLCLEGQASEDVANGSRTPRYPDSTAEKFKELCRLGGRQFEGQPAPGFPCHLIATDLLADSRSVMIAAWGRNYAELRASRAFLWKNRTAISTRRWDIWRPPELAVPNHSVIVCVHFSRRLRGPAALRFKLLRGHRAALVRGGSLPVNFSSLRHLGKYLNRTPFHVVGRYVFVPIRLGPGNMVVAFRSRTQTNEAKHFLTTKQH